VCASRTPTQFFTMISQFKPLVIAFCLTVGTFALLGCRREPITHIDPELSIRLLGYIYAPPENTSSEKRSSRYSIIIPLQIPSYARGPAGVQIWDHTSQVLKAKGIDIQRVDEVVITPEGLVMFGEFESRSIEQSVTDLKRSPYKRLFEGSMQIDDTPIELIFRDPDTIVLLQPTDERKREIEAAVSEDRQMEVDFALQKEIRESKNAVFFEYGQLYALPLSPERLEFAWWIKRTGNNDRCELTIRLPYRSMRAAQEAMRDLHVLRNRVKWFLTGDPWGENDDPFYEGFAFFSLYDIGRMIVGRRSFGPSDYDNLLPGRPGL